MEPKFTPGPWGAMVKMEGCTAIGANTLIARVYSTAFKDLENERANANLISAAPDMYDALFSAAEQLERNGVAVPDSWKAALAKARGESPKGGE